MKSDRGKNRILSLAQKIIHSPELGSDKRLHRSKLQICIEILCSLVSKGSIKLSQISDDVELDKTRLIPYLRLLKNRGLIEKQNLGENKIFYVVTDRGLKVLRVINPIIKEAHKIQLRNLEAISRILSAANF